MNVYLDASAVVKLYHKEVGSDRLLGGLRAQADDLILTVADITRTEFHSAFLRRVRTKEIPIEPVYKVFDAFDRDSLMFNQIPVDGIVKELAVFNPEDTATP